MEAIHQQYGDKGVVILGVSSTQLELRGGQDRKKPVSKSKTILIKKALPFLFL